MKGSFRCAKAMVINMGLIHKHLSDGITLHYLETDKFKTNFMSVSFIAPLGKDTAAKNTLIPAILLRGSEQYPDMAAISRRLDYLYASRLSARNYKRGETQIFGLTAGMIDSAYTIGGEDLVAEMTGMLAEILLHPLTEGKGFNAAYTASEKNNQIDAINANINNKAYYAKLRCTEEMCRGERFGLSENGTVDDVNACTPENLYEQYRYALKYYPIEIFFVGQCDADRLAERLTALFGALERAPVTVPPTEVIRKAGEPKRISEDMPVTQGKLCIGFRSGTTLREDDYVAFMLFSSIFGGSPTSKLFMNVREKKSLCYYCSSAPDAVKGLMFVNSGIEPDKREAAEDAIFEQLRSVQEGDFTDDEYQSALLGLINSYNELSDSAGGLETWYLGRLLLGIENDPDDVIEALKKVTREEIAAAAKGVSLDTVYFLNGTLKGEGEDD